MRCLNCNRIAEEVPLTTGSTEIIILCKDCHHNLTEYQKYDLWATKVREIYEKQFYECWGDEES